MARWSHVHVSYGHGLPTDGDSSLPHCRHDWHTDNSSSAYWLCGKGQLMALGTTNDLTMHSGDTFRLEVTVNDSLGAPLDISTATITWALSRKRSDKVSPRGDALVTKAATVIDGPTGRCNVTLYEADTAGLSGVYYHELQVTIGASVSTVIYGTFTIAKDLI